MRITPLLFLAPALFGQAAKISEADWPMFNSDLAGTRYSPLRQIAPRNVASLKQAWSYRLQPANFRFATIFKNIVMVGASTGEREDGPPGNTRAYDARTGAELWEFVSVPGPGEVGHETWLDNGSNNGGWKNRSGTNLWGWYMTADEERSIVYMTFGARRKIIVSAPLIRNRARSYGRASSSARPTPCR